MSSDFSGEFLWWMFATRRISVGRVSIGWADSEAKSMKGEDNHIARLKQEQ